MQILYFTTCNSIDYSAQINPRLRRTMQRFREKVLVAFRMRLNDPTNCKARLPGYSG